jgi:predicted lipoprotein with Yx(FWY)xxD motif
MRSGIYRAALASAALLSLPALAADFAVPATPPGVTVEPPIHIAAMEAGKVGLTTQGSFADPNGMTLYVFADDTVPGQSACAGDCATDWPALAAPADAKPAGDWSLAARVDGTKQWAYRGKPLYRSAKDAKPGDMNGKAADDGKWQVAAIQQPTDEAAAPAAITLRSLNNAQGDVFVDYRGMTLYTFDGDTVAGASACLGDCAKVWHPLTAAGLAKPLGDWTIVARGDGTRQWAFRGKPLYGFSGDVKPGDAKGMVADTKFHPAALRRYFIPPEVTARINGGNMVLATADGMTLYARDKFRFSFGSYSVNDGPPPTPAVGRAIGTAGCDGDCTHDWVPLKAAPDAQASGFWSIALRGDGTRQWAYQGYPVYTNAHDKKPGDMLGRDKFDLTDGSHALYWRVVTP